MSKTKNKWIYGTKRESGTFTEFSHPDAVHADTLAYSSSQSIKEAIDTATAPIDGSGYPNTFAVWRDSTYLGIGPMTTDGTDITVSGDATFSGNLKVAGYIDIDATVIDNLNITGDATIGSFLKLSAGSSINELSTDVTLGGNSDIAVPTEKAVKTYVDSQVGSAFDGTGTPNYVAIFDSTSSISNSIIYSDGSHVGIDTTSFPSWATGYQALHLWDPQLAIFGQSSNKRLRIANNVYYDGAFKVVSAGSGLMYDLDYITDARHEFKVGESAASPGDPANLIDILTLGYQEARLNPGNNNVNFEVFNTSAVIFASDADNSAAAALGIGLSPSDRQWDANTSVLEFKGNTSISSNDSNDTMYLRANNYNIFSGGSVANITGPTSRLTFGPGTYALEMTLSSTGGSSFSDWTSIITADPGTLTINSFNMDLDTDIHTQAGSAVFVDADVKRVSVNKDSTSIDLYVYDDSGLLYRTDSTASYAQYFSTKILYFGDLRSNSIVSDGDPENFHISSQENLYIYASSPEKGIILNTDNTDSHGIKIVGYDTSGNQYNPLSGGTRNLVIDEYGNLIVSTISVSGITGSGTIDFLPVWDTTASITDSHLRQSAVNDNTSIIIGKTVSKLWDDAASSDPSWYLQLGTLSTVHSDNSGSYLNLSWGINRKSDAQYHTLPGASTPTYLQLSDDIFDVKRAQTITDGTVTAWYDIISYVSSTVNIANGILSVQTDGIHVTGDMSATGVVYATDATFTGSGKVHIVEGSGEPLIRVTRGGNDFVFGIEDVGNDFAICAGTDLNASGGAVDCFLSCDTALNEMRFNPNGRKMDTILFSNVGSALEVNVDSSAVIVNSGNNKVNFQVNSLNGTTFYCDSDNTGIGVVGIGSTTTYNWSAVYNAMVMNKGSMSYNTSSNLFRLMFNVYNTDDPIFGDAYMTTGAASIISFQNDGNIAAVSVPSGTGGTAVSTQKSFWTCNLSGDIAGTFGPTFILNPDQTNVDLRVEGDTDWLLRTDATAGDVLINSDVNMYIGASSQWYIRQNSSDTYHHVLLNWPDDATATTGEAYVDDSGYLRVK